MRRLANVGHQVDVQILYNKVSADFKINIVEDRGSTYQLVTPNIHQKNVAERHSYLQGAFLISVSWVRPHLSQVSMGQPIGENRDHTQPSSTSHTQPTHVGVGIF